MRVRMYSMVDFFTSKVRERVVLVFCTEKMALNVVSPKNTGFSILLEGLFGLIFMSNFFGLLPFSQTMTSQLIFTIFFSFIAMLVVWLQAFFLNKIFFFSHFLPNGAPLVIAPFIIIIEVISNLSRLLSLSVRLFANMTSGHALLKILSSFVFVAAIFVAG